MPQGRSTASSRRRASREATEQHGTHRDRRFPARDQLLRPHAHRLRVLRRASRPSAAGARPGRAEMAVGHQLCAVRVPEGNGAGARLCTPDLDQRRGRWLRHARCLRAHRRRDGRHAFAGDAGRCNLPRPAWRGRVRGFRGLRRRTAAAHPRLGRRRGAGGLQPRLPCERHARDGRLCGRRRGLSYLPACGPGRHRRARRARAEAGARARTPGRARVAQAGLPAAAQLPVHDDRPVEGDHRTFGTAWAGGRSD